MPFSFLDFFCAYFCCWSSKVDAKNLDTQRAAAIYKEHGCLVVRGLNRQYVDAINRDVQETAEQTLKLLPEKVQIAVCCLRDDLSNP